MSQVSLQKSLENRILAGEWKTDHTIVPAFNELKYEWQRNIWDNALILNSHVGYEFFMQPEVKLWDNHNFTEYYLKNLANRQNKVLSLKFFNDIQTRNAQFQWQEEELVFLFNAQGTLNEMDLRFNPVFDWVKKHYNVKERLLLSPKIYKYNKCILLNDFLDNHSESEIKEIFDSLGAESRYKVAADIFMFSERYEYFPLFLPGLKEFTLFNANSDKMYWSVLLDILFQSSMKTIYEVDKVCDYQAYLNAVSESGHSLHKIARLGETPKTQTLGFWLLDKCLKPAVRNSILHNMMTANKHNLIEEVIEKEKLTPGYIPREQFAHMLHICAHNVEPEKAQEYAHEIYKLFETRYKDNEKYKSWLNDNVIFATEDLPAHLYHKKYHISTTNMRTQSFMQETYKQYLHDRLNQELMEKPVSIKKQKL